MKGFEKCFVRVGVGGILEGLKVQLLVNNSVVDTIVGVFTVFQSPTWMSL